MKGILLFLIGLFAVTMVSGQNKKILFVCEHGSAKSVIAATYFNKMAKERGLPWEAITRGINPDKELSSNTSKGLSEDKLLNEKIIPNQLSKMDFEKADKIVLFNPLPDSFKVKTNLQMWLGLPAVSEDYTKARNGIVQKLNVLLDSLQKH